jgi:hypothetical protein
MQEVLIFSPGRYMTFKSELSTLSRLNGAQQTFLAWFAGMRLPVAPSGQAGGTLCASQPRDTTWTPHQPAHDPSGARH